MHDDEFWGVGGMVFEFPPPPTQYPLWHVEISGHIGGKWEKLLVNKSVHDD